MQTDLILKIIEIAAGKVQAKNNETRSDVIDEKCFDIIRSGNSKFQDHWEWFVGNNDNVGPFYTYLFLSQMVERGKVFSAKNCSFIILYKNNPVAITPLLLERFESHFFFSSNLGFNAYNGPLISINSGVKLRRKIRECCFKEIDRLAEKYGVVKCMISIDPFNKFCEKEYFNYCTLYGYMDASITTQVVELSVDTDILKRNCRSSYKALINKGLKEYDLFIVNNENADYKIHEDYRKLHLKAAGRATRSRRTFDIQFETLKKGEATLIGARHKGKIVHFNFYNYLNGYVYYSSAADDPEFNASSVSPQHAITWFAIDHFKKCGFKYFELGWMFYGVQFFQCVTQKDIGISFFKRGFGGISIPLFRGVKYYDKGYMRQDIEMNIDNLIKNEIK